MTLRVDTRVDGRGLFAYSRVMGRRDLTGLVSGRLTVTGYSHSNKYGVAYWKCACTCGATPAVRATSLTKGQTLSCGCFALEDIRRRATDKTRDIAGSRFGRLLARRPVGRDAQNVVRWECECDCGRIVSVRKTALISGATKSCGCYSREQTSKRLLVHGGTGTAAHKAWRHMMQRCNNPKHHAYSYYGGRGICVCPAWLDYSVFVRDMGEPAKGETLDRINPDGNYEPSNCRWTSRLVQARNQRARKNASGVTGVYRTKSGKWASQIKADGKRFCSPARATLEEAVADRKELERLHWGDER